MTPFEKRDTSRDESNQGKYDVQFINSRICGYLFADLFSSQTWPRPREGFASVEGRKTSSLQTSHPKVNLQLQPLHPIPTANHDDISIRHSHSILTQSTWTVSRDTCSCATTVLQVSLGGSYSATSGGASIGQPDNEQHRNRYRTPNDNHHTKR